jgi:hypothetical protein
VRLFFVVDAFAAGFIKGGLRERGFHLEAGSSVSTALKRFLLREAF